MEGGQGEATGVGAAVGGGEASTTGAAWGGLEEEEAATERLDVFPAYVFEEEGGEGESGSGGGGG